MINAEKFAKRLQKILDYYDLSAAAFADEIHVGRSSISHILSGRNNPSLDFVLKVISSFPEVELYWLLNGKGDFPKQVETSSKSGSTEQVPEISTGIAPKSSAAKEKPVKIVWFYKDGTFDVFEN